MQARRKGRFASGGAARAALRFDVQYNPRRIRWNARSRRSFSHNRCGGCRSGSGCSLLSWSGRHPCNPAHRVLVAFGGLSAGLSGFSQRFLD
jgi:hypothetical protein